MNISQYFDKRYDLLTAVTFSVHTVVDSCIVLIYFASRVGQMGSTSYHNPEKAQKFIAYTFTHIRLCINTHNCLTYNRHDLSTTNRTIYECLNIMHVFLLYYVIALYVFSYTCSFYSHHVTKRIEPHLIEL